MSPEAQRLAIAKACPHLFEVGASTFGGKLLYHTGTHQCLPADPLSDLNVIHEMEKSLKPHKLHAYSRELRAICADIDVWAATAAQRAEAFLRATGKWKATS